MLHGIYRLSHHFERRPIRLALFLFVGLLLLRGLQSSSYVLSNGGFILLNQATASEKLAAERAARAERLLWLATVLAPDNASAWRSLGHTLIIQGDEDAAMVAWEKAGSKIIEEFIWRGERAKREGRFEEALLWYERGQRLRRSWGDWSYYMALTYIEIGRNEEALVTLQEGLSLPLSTIGKSDVYYQLGLMHSEYLVPIEFSSALVYFDKAIAQNDFSTRTPFVNAHYERAEVLRQLGREEEALDAYEVVVSQEPKHYWARVRAGLLHWQRRQDTERAEVRLKDAILLQPRIKWAYRILGQIYQETGRDVEALEMYQQVLAIDSQDSFAREQVDKIRAGED